MFYRFGSASFQIYIKSNTNCYIHDAPEKDHLTDLKKAA